MLKKITQNFRLTFLQIIWRFSCVIFCLSSSVIFSQMYISDDAHFYIGDGTSLVDIHEKSIVKNNISTINSSHLIYVSGGATVIDKSSTVNLAKITASSEPKKLQQLARNKKEKETPKIPKPTCENKIHPSHEYTFHSQNNSAFFNANGDSECVTIVVISIMLMEIQSVLQL